MEGKYAHDELSYAKITVDKMIAKCKADITALETIGGSVKEAIAERNDALAEYTHARQRIHKALEIVDWHNNDNELW